MKKTIYAILVLCLLLVFAACNKDSSENLKEKNCEHTYTETITAQASCAQVGTKTFACSQCGNTYTEEIPVLEHSYGDWILTVKPSYSAIGQEKSTCSGCGNFKTRDVPMLEPVTVQLNKDNFLDYFAIDCHVADYREEDGRFFTFGYATVKVNCNLKVDGDLSNVSVKLVLYSNEGIWNGQDYDPISMSIASRTGTANATQEIGVCSTDSLEVEKPHTIKFTILEVSGTIVARP